jgi:5-methylcytosine-specific restriction endonuclease McrA
LSGLDRFPKKTCKFCKDPNPSHFPYQCRANPKVALKRKKRLQRTPIKKVGKQTKQWFLTRATWIRKNPPDENGYWYCYLNIHPWCPRKLTIETLTLDHVVARTKDQSKKFVQNNLKPACGYCNNMKGSRPLEQVKPTLKLK